MWQIGPAFLWGIVLAAAFATTRPPPWLLTLTGVGCGGLVGHLRSRAIAAGKRTTLAAALAWLCGIGLLVLAMAFAEDMFLGAWAASFAGCLLVGSVYSLWTSHRAKRMSSAMPAEGG